MCSLDTAWFLFEVFSGQTGTGGSLAFLHRTSVTKNIAVSTRDFIFTAFEMCEVCLFHDGLTAVFLSVTVPHMVYRTSVLGAVFRSARSMFLAVGFL